MNAAPRIERLGAAALPAVEAISLAAFDPAYGEAWSKAQCLSVLALPGYRLSGAWIDVGQGGSVRIAPRPGGDAVLAGFAIDRSVADESELLLLAVHPAYRRRGIAGRLLNDWLAGARNRGVRRAFLEMRENNPARALYAAHDFVEVGRRKDYYRGADGTSFHAVTMERHL